ncbi:hypothetical protein BpHYR1_039173 [Brachionus plicatilis]|uniref:Uncharacterized protein n=1 Tax=Brachionus plicatilis TaxID=10195 RepID=A0A3M7QNZ8_BRAPC|nr:hypothetical protein BpHYR1_039173 [Brachionus plicatilis]
MNFKIQILNFFILFLLANQAESIRRGRYRIRSRLRDPTNDAISTLSLKDKQDVLMKAAPNNPTSKFHSDNPEPMPFKRTLLSNEEFQTKVLDLLEDIRNLSLDNFGRDFAWVAIELNRNIA